MSSDVICTVPPAGWHCTRVPGHDGPCAAHPTETAALTARLATVEAERDAAVALLTNYRAAVAFVATDSWDGCSDCIEVLRAASCADDGRTVTPDQLAADLRKLRLTARTFDIAEGERRATAAIVADLRATARRVQYDYPQEAQALYVAVSRYERGDHLPSAGGVGEGA